jgi:hypothetical protein
VDYALLFAGKPGALGLTWLFWTVGVTRRYQTLSSFAGGKISSNVRFVFRDECYGNTTLLCMTLYVQYLTSLIPNSRFGIV